MNRFSIGGLALLAAACSGADGSGLLMEPSGPQDDAAVAQSDASVQEDVTTTLDATTPDVVHKDAVVADAATDVVVGPPDSKIQCGPYTTCSAQKQLCCWHQASTTKQFECVSSSSACLGVYDVPITCSTSNNCASQGNPGYQCCATGGNIGWGTCSNYEVAARVECKAQCAQTDYELGCSVQQQNCFDPLQTCITSQCTVPGDTMCY